MAFPRAALLTEARSWLGTPWHHQAAVKGVGCDCIGFVRGAAEPFLGAIEQPMDYAATWPLYRAEERLREAVALYADEVDTAAMRPGDVLLFGVGRGPAHHCGYLGDGGRLLHCYREAGAVVDQDLTDFWTDKLRGVFRLRGILG